MGTFAHSSQVEFLYYFSNETFDIVEAKILALPADAPPAEVYHWLCYDRRTQQFEKLEFKAMARDRDWNYREFIQAKLSFNSKEARLYKRAAGNAQDLELNVGDPQALPAQLVAAIERHLGLHSGE